MCCAGPGGVLGLCDGYVGGWCVHGAWVEPGASHTPLHCAARPWLNLSHKCSSPTNCVVPISRIYKYMVCSPEPA